MAKFSVWVDAEVDDDEVIDYISKNYTPGDIFPESELRDWANSNGFIEEPTEEE